MTPEDYIRNAVSTESLIDRISNSQVMRLLHASQGMQTESAEFTDMLKRHIFYDYNFDRVNALEELGDQLWYIALAIDVLHSSFAEVMEANIAKLQFRYPDQFDNVLAISRDSKSEREILEKIFQQSL